MKRCSSGQRSSVPGGTLYGFQVTTSLPLGDKWTEGSGLGNNAFLRVPSTESGHTDRSARGGMDGQRGGGFQGLDRAPGQTPCGGTASRVRFVVRSGKYTGVISWGVITDT